MLERLNNTASTFQALQYGNLFFFLLKSVALWKSWNCLKMFSTVIKILWHLTLIVYQRFISGLSGAGENILEQQQQKTLWNNFTKQIVFIKYIHLYSNHWSLDSATISNEHRYSEDCVNQGHWLLSSVPALQHLVQGSRVFRKVPALQVETLHVLTLHVGSECKLSPPRSDGILILSLGWKLLMDLLMW